MAKIIKIGSVFFRDQYSRLVDGVGARDISDAIYHQTEVLCVLSMKTWEQMVE